MKLSSICSVVSDGLFIKDTGSYTLTLVLDDNVALREDTLRIIGNSNPKNIQFDVTDLGVGNMTAMLCWFPMGVVQQIKCGIIVGSKDSLILLQVVESILAGFKTSIDDVNPEELTVDMKNKCRSLLKVYKTGIPEYTEKDIDIPIDFKYTRKCLDEYSRYILVNKTGSARHYLRFVRLFFDLLDEEDKKI